MSSPALIGCGCVTGNVLGCAARDTSITAGAAMLAPLRLERAAGSPAPILPGPIDAVGTGARNHLVYLAHCKEFDGAHLHCLLLQPGVDLEIYRNIDGVPDIPAGHGRPMT